MDHQIKITQEDFSQFNKVLKVIYNDLNNLLIQNGVIHLTIKEDGNIYFNQNKTGIILTEQDRVLRALFNFYFLILKNSNLFDASFSVSNTTDQRWFKEYNNLILQVKKIKQSEPEKPSWYSRHQKS